MALLIVNCYTTKLRSKAENNFHLINCLAFFVEKPEVIQGFRSQLSALSVLNCFLGIGLDNLNSILNLRKLYCPLCLDAFKSHISLT